MSDAGPTRRAVLATGVAAAAAFVAGCARTAAAGAAGVSGSPSGAAPTSAAAATPAAATSAPAAPTTAAAAHWATVVSASESNLVADYTAVIKAHPALKVTLTPLLAAHRAHVAALKSSLGGAASVTVGATDQAISRLAQAEQRASDVAAKQCLTCPTQAAALLGSIAAANASHLVVLAGLGSVGAP